MLESLHLLRAQTRLCSTFLLNDFSPNMNRLFLFAMPLACAAILAGCGTARPLYIPPEQPVVYNLDAKDVRAAIVAAAQAGRWRIASDQPGVMELAYPSNARAAKYEATFAVRYTDKSYKIEYVRSRGLDEKLNCEGATPCLHRNASKWTTTLNRGIQRKLADVEKQSKMRIAIRESAQQNRMEVLSDQDGIVQLAYKPNSASSQDQIVFSVRYAEQTFAILPANGQSSNAQNLTPSQQKEIEQLLAKFRTDIEQTYNTNAQKTNE